MSLPGFPSVTPFILSQGEKGGFTICLYLALPLSVILWQGEKGGCLMYVSTWLCLCQSSCGKVKRGWFLSLPGFAFVSRLMAR